jgi:hypothetical protein
MDRWLKWLIAAACCVVIIGGVAAGVSKFASWQDAKGNQAAADASADRESCRQLIKDKQARDAGQPPLQEMSDALLRLKLRGCTQDHPELADEIGLTD